MMGQAERIEDALSGVTGVVKTETVATPSDSPQSRAELYALRDQSGLSRREFYLRNIPVLPSDRVKVEVKGC